LICWLISVWNCCKPLFSLLYNCQLLYQDTLIMV
jgi:hypothetical protein